MKVGSAHTHLRLVSVEPEGTEICSMIAWDDQASLADVQEVAAHSVHSFQWCPDDRAGWIAVLRARIKSGAYKIDSMTITESILSDKIHYG